MKTGHLYILEGPDGGGKTTLAQQLHDRLKALGQRVKILHHGPYLGQPSIGHHFFLSMCQALEREDTHIIMDRCWLSDDVYGPIMRAAPTRITPAERHMLERAALTCDATLVYCHTDKARMLATWESRKATEYPDDRAKVSKIIDLYEDVINDAARGVARVWYYDYALTAFETLWAMLSDRGTPDSRLTAPLAGNGHDPKAILIGDRSNHDFLTRPFFSFNQVGCSWWLADQLAQAGIDEYQLLWANAHSPRGVAYQWATLAPFTCVPIFVLGETAKAWYVDHCPLKDQARHDVRYHKHPMYWKRFHASERYPLLDDLAQALR